MKKTIATTATTINKETFIWDPVHETKHVSRETHAIVSMKNKVYDIVRKGNIVVVIDASEGYALEASDDGNPRRQLSGWGYTLRLSYEGITAALKAANASGDKGFEALIREYIIPRYRRYIDAE